MPFRKDTSVSKYINKILWFLFIGTAVLFAGPRIQIDSTIFHCGTISEGKTDQIKAHFVVKNIGDEVLKIIAKPNCGCTVVEYDSLINPSKKTRIHAEVNLNGYNKGNYSKTITVTTNDTARPFISLTIDAPIQSIIDVSADHVNLNVSKSQLPDTINIYSGRRDLKILEVFFKPEKAHNKANEKDAETKIDRIRIPVKFALINTTSTRAEDGNKLFKLLVYPPSTGNLSSGKLIVKTNQADKSIIVLGGNLVN